MGADPWHVDDEESFMACYHATLPDVFRYAAMLCGHDRATAEDIVQDTYIAALRRVRAGDLGSITTGYLTLSVRHRFLDAMKQRDREQRRITAAASTDARTSTSRHEVFAQLADLPDRERTAMVLRFVDDLPVAAVATALRLSIAATESLIVRATRRLRNEVPS
jgi:RNA polymerase sigma factor (sigma-70 family)